jgi:uncharacterized protein YndB with AHSA1/START domain
MTFRPVPGKHILLVTTLVMTLAMSGCGDSLGKLNQLSASGSIHQDAPVTAHVSIQIAAPASRVWTLLTDAPSWPSWASQIDSVGSSGPLTNGKTFIWKSGGMTIHSQVHLFDPERRLSWTGTAMSAKAVHVWELTPEPNGATKVTVDESMDGFMMSALYSSEKLVESDKGWLLALKQAAEKK